MARLVSIGSQWSITMHNRTRLFLGAGAATLLALGGLAGLARADMQDGPGGGTCGMARFHRLEPGGMMGRQLMERYDANKDGKVTQAEIDQNRQQWLADADTNKDGTLSLDEFKALWLRSRNEMMVREFQFFDRDGNGQVTIEEYRGPLSDVVATRDRNQDGALGADDRPAAGEGSGERPRWRHLHGRMGEGMGPGRGQGHGMMGGGNGPCMGDRGGADAPADDAGDAPGDAPAAP
jgi:hypothetical protein